MHINYILYIDYWKIISINVTFVRINTVWAALNNEPVINKIKSLDKRKIRYNNDI